jgi:predicted ATP-dependent Lon-type protease
VTGAPSPDLHATIARALALCERRLRESVDEPRAELGMTVIEGVVADVDDILGPVLEAFNAAAKEMGLPARCATTAQGHRRPSRSCGRI